MKLTRIKGGLKIELTPLIWLIMLERGNRHKSWSNKLGDEPLAGEGDVGSNFREYKMKLKKVKGGLKVELTPRIWIIMLKRGNSHKSWSKGTGDEPLATER